MLASMRVSRVLGARWSFRNPGSWQHHHLAAALSANHGAQVSKQDGGRPENSLGAFQLEAHVLDELLVHRPELVT